MKFNEILKKLRKDKNLSQRELAAALQLSKSAISMYESGKREPNYETLEHIATYFDVDMNYVLGKETKHTDTLEHSSITNIEEAVHFLMEQPFITEMSNIDIASMNDEELIKASNIIADMIRTGLKCIEK